MLNVMSNKARKAQVYLVAFIFFIVVAGIPTVVGEPNVVPVPVTVVSVREVTTEDGYISPGGPILNITLKSNSDVPIVKLSASFTATDFMLVSRTITVEFPSLQNREQTVWRRVNIISSLLNTTHPLNINGTLQNGETFSYVFTMTLNTTTSTHPFYPLPLYSVSPPVMKGDVDGDNKLTIVDAFLIALHVSGIKSFSIFELAVADINNDNKVTIDDALYIARCTVGLRKC